MSCAASLSRKAPGSRDECYLFVSLCQVAMTSGSGVVIQPVQSTARTLALTMGTFVTRLLGQLNGQIDLPPGPPQVHRRFKWLLLLYRRTKQEQQDAARECPTRRNHPGVHYIVHGCVLLALLLSPRHVASHLVEISRGTCTRCCSPGDAGRAPTPRHQRDDADREGRVGRLHAPRALSLVRKLHTLS